MLIIRESQMQAFRDACQRAYREKIQAQVDARLKQDQIAPSLPLDRLVDTGLNRAGDYDIFNEGCIVRLTVFLAKYGPEVNEASDGAWAREILCDPRRSDAEKMDALESAARGREQAAAC